ncbi:MAG: PIN domain-containing protein [Bryobacteraceae bacterium]|nr:PIN domain-containing protein [Bryobacteraceae bacterium]
MAHPKLNLDTNIVLSLVWNRLRPRERKLLDESRCGISSIVLWELRKLYRLKRLEFNVDGEREREALERLDVWPVTAEICHLTQRLDFQSDPADELIAATSLAHGVPLLTRDDKILASKVVPLA